MPIIGIRDEHDELRLSLQRWVESRCPPAVTRAALDAGRTPSRLLGRSRRPGTLGIHLPEEFGGQGAGMVELAVVAEELGRAAAPGPWARRPWWSAPSWPRAGAPPWPRSSCPGWSTGPSPPRWSCPRRRPTVRRWPAPGLTGQAGRRRLARRRRADRSGPRTGRRVPCCWPRSTWPARCAGPCSSGRIRARWTPGPASTRHAARRRGCWTGRWWPPRAGARRVPPPSGP